MNNSDKSDNNDNDYDNIDSPKKNSKVDDDDNHCYSIRMIHLYSLFVVFTVAVFVFDKQVQIIFVESFVLVSTTSTSFNYRRKRIASTPLPLLLAVDSRYEKQQQQEEEQNTEIGKCIIDYQSNKKQFGRGEQHISAILNEGDTIIYRTGSWYIDGVLVGDSDEDTTEYKICRLNTMQVVWTHNCEHGVIHGLAINMINNDEEKYEEISTEGHDEKLKNVAEEPSNESTCTTTTTTTAGNTSC